ACRTRTGRAHQDPLTTGPQTPTRKHGPTRVPGSAGLVTSAHNESMNLLPEPPATLLPEDPAAAALAAGTDPREAAARYPASSLAWAGAARQAREHGQTLE